MDQTYSHIMQLLELYFDGLYSGEVSMLKKAFHPEARYITASTGALLHLGMEKYFEMVARRPSPASQKQGRMDKVLSIEIIGPQTALAKVQCAIAAKHFTDLLSLICVHDRWQIISKVFHYQLIEEDICP